MPTEVFFIFCLMSWSVYSRAALGAAVRRENLIFSYFMPLQRDQVSLLSVTDCGNSSVISISSLKIHSN